MSQSSDHHWDKLFSAIGKVVCQWARLERELGSTLHEAMIAATPGMARNGNAQVNVWTMIENMDLRAIVSTIKALIFALTWDHDFETPIIQCLNRIENELRNERNRFVHDEWQVSPTGKVRRVQRGSKLVRQQGSGAELLHHGYEQSYESYKDIEAVALRIQSARDEVATFKRELMAFYSTKPQTR